MATAVKLMLLAFFVYCTFQGGNGRLPYCDPLQDIIIAQFPTHRMVKGKPQWVVNVTNDCICTEFGIKLKCDGFQTVEELDPKVVTVSDGICSLDPNDELGIGGMSQDENITFTYAWDTQFPFKVATASMGCS